MNVNGWVFDVEPSKRLSPNAFQHATQLQSMKKLTPNNTNEPYTTTDKIQACIILQKHFVTVLRLTENKCIQVAVRCIGELLTKIQDSSTDEAPTVTTPTMQAGEKRCLPKISIRIRHTKLHLVSPMWKWHDVRSSIVGCLAVLAIQIPSEMSTSPAKKKSIWNKLPLPRNTIFNDTDIANWPPGELHAPTQQVYMLIYTIDPERDCRRMSDWISL
jgi:hypothetical protein